jgi:hypothetical protein
MIEHGYPEKFEKRDILGVNQPLKANGPEESGEQISCQSKGRPEEIKAFQKGIKVFDGDLCEEEEDDSYGDDDGN